MNRNLAVGIFVVSGLVIFAGGLFLIGDSHKAFTRHFTVYTGFNNLAGLAKGAKVQVGGMDAGQISEVQIPNSPSSPFRLKVEINETFHGLVRSNSLATIGTEGVVGDVFLAIKPGTASSPEIPAGASLPSKEATQISDLLDQAQGTIRDVDATVKNANGLLTSVGGNLNSTLTTARGTLTDADTIINGVKRGDGVAGMLLRDPKAAASVRQTLANTQAATASLQHTASQADGLIADINSRGLPQKVDDTLTSAKDAAAKIDTASQGVQQLVSQLNTPGPDGNTTIGTLQETLTNADTATGNIAEDSEALKHNFLFKGFFRHRSYFTLMGIPPAQYRKDPAFSSPRDTRVWLDTSKLFIQLADGSEALTPAGKIQLDQALAAEPGSTIEGTPIMVEGYADTGDGANALRISRHRALLIRTYMKDHYQLEASTIGAIGLSSQPPNGVQRSNTSNLCLVLIHPAH